MGLVKHFCGVLLFGRHHQDCSNDSKNCPLRIHGIESDLIEMHEGKIIEFIDHGKFVCTLCLQDKGNKLHLLITVGGLILDFELAPANATDLEVGVEMLEEHANLDALGDKGYISAGKAAQLWRKNRVRLRTIPRRHQKRNYHLT